MNQKEERAYIQGQRSAWANIAAEAGRALAIGGGDTIEGKLAHLMAEREQAIAALRSVCEAHGDNDWDPTLHLADVIEKHLGRNLDSAAQKRGSRSR